MCTFSSQSAAFPPLRCLSVSFTCGCNNWLRFQSRSLASAMVLRACGEPHTLTYRVQSYMSCIRIGVKSQANKARTIDVKFANTQYILSLQLLIHHGHRRSHLTFHRSNTHFSYCPIIEYLQQHQTPRRQHCTALPQAQRGRFTTSPYLRRSPGDIRPSHRSPPRDCPRCSRPRERLHLGRKRVPVTPPHCE
jgi:hypothetical protein